MAVIDALQPLPFVYGGHIYARPPEPIHFPSEEPFEEKVPETKRHLEARTMLYLLLKDAFQNAAVGSDQFVYWHPRDPRKNLAPDVFVKVGTPDSLFDTWKVWERGDLDVAIEIVSAHDQEKLTWAEKMERYEACGVRELVRFDEGDRVQPIHVWDRVDGQLVERDAKDPDLRACGALQLWWTVATTPNGRQLRLARDKAGVDLLATPLEDRVRLAQEIAEERKARAEAEHARLLAEEAHTRAVEERSAAEARAAQAERDLEALQTEIARLKAEQAKR